MIKEKLVPAKTQIQISKVLAAKLQVLRLELGLKNYEELIAYLINKG